MILEYKEERQNSQKGTHWKFIDQVDRGNLRKNDPIWKEEKEVVH